MIFNQMVEGKEYRVTNLKWVSSIEIFEKRNGLLFSKRTQRYSNFTASDIFEFNFEEVLEVNKKTKDFLKILDPDFNWIVRDEEDETVWLFDCKPYKDCEGNWQFDDGISTELYVASCLDPKIDFDFLKVGDCYEIEELIEMG